MILEERKKKILKRLNKTLKNTTSIIRNINIRLEDIYTLNKDLIRTVDVYKIWKDKL